MDNELSRRAWLGLAGANAVAVLAACGAPKSVTATTITVAAPPGSTTGPPRPMITDADAALSQLEEGNRRFVEARLQHPGHDPESRRGLLRSQQPFAAILTCSDSRVPPELLFDQGLGDLFVVRVAGNIIDAAVLGSIEFAVLQLRTPLIVVMGHQHCGAVSATLDSIRQHTVPHGDTASFVTAIAPAVTLAEQRPGDLLDNTVRANAERSRDAIVESAELNERLHAGALKVVAAYYNLEAGAVTWI